MLPLDREAALEKIAPMKKWRVRLLRMGDVDRVHYERDVDAHTHTDAVALIEQRAVVDHPGDVYELDAVSRVWRPRPEVDRREVTA